jgi:hypothetical protein
MTKNYRLLLTIINAIYAVALTRRCAEFGGTKPLQIYFFTKF